MAHMRHALEGCLESCHGEALGKFSTDPQADDSSDEDDEKTYGDDLIE